MGAAPTSESLKFAHSESMIAGVKAHAREVSGVGNVIGDGMTVVSAVVGAGAAATNPLGWLFLPATIMMVGSRLPMIASGHNAEKRIAAEQEEARQHVWRMAHPEAPKPLHEKMKEDAAKVLHPGQHPIEAAAALNFLAGAIFLAMGVGGIIGAIGTGGLAVPLLNTALGAVMMASRANEVFADDKYEREEREQWEHLQAEQESLHFGKSQSKQVGAKGPLRNMFRVIEENPSRVSGAVAMVGSAMMIGIGVLTGNWVYAAASAIYLASATTYTAFVSREESSQQQKPGQHESTDPALTHVERLAKRGHVRRGQDGHSHVARLQAERDHGMGDAQPSLG